MSKILLVGKCNPDEIKKLVTKLFCADSIEQVDGAPTVFDENLFVCADGERGDVANILKELGYKTVTIAYTQSAINQTIGNSDLEKHGYKFEDGV